MITTQTELDVSPGGIPPTIHVSQYDTGSRTLLLNLISGRWRPDSSDGNKGGDSRHQA